MFKGFVKTTILYHHQIERKDIQTLKIVQGRKEK